MLKRLLMLSAALLLAAPTEAQKWDAYKGTTLNVALSVHPWANSIRKFFPEFEKQTGIKLNVTMYPEADFRNKLPLDLAGANKVDVYMISPGQDARLYNKKGWAEDLSPYIKNTSLTASSWDIRNFTLKVLQTAQAGSSLIGIPVQAETPMLFYRKDIFAKYSIPVPKTLTELEAAAKALNGKDGMVGIALRGKGASATSQFSPYMFSYGSDWLTSDEKANFTDPKFVQAMTYYTNLIKNYGPKNATDMSWQEVTKLFGQGKAAMFTDASLFRSIVDDPTSSTVTGKVGYARFPAGPEGSHPYLTTWALGMNKASTSKNAAWLFIQWASNKQNQLRVLLEDVPAVRKSVWQDPTFVKQDKHPEWSSIQARQMDTAEPNWNPPVVSVGDVRNVLGDAIVNILKGGNVTDNLKQAAQKTDAFIQRDQ